MTRRGMNNYLAGIMLGILVIAIVMILYAVSKDNFLVFREIINKISGGLGI